MGTNGTPRKEQKYQHGDQKISDKVNLGAVVWDREKRRHSSYVAQDIDGDDGQ